MKITINKEFIKNIITYSAILILVFFSTTGLLYESSSTFLKETLNLSLSNLGLITGIKILSGIVDFLSGIQDIVEKIFNYFLAINGLIFFQMTLLKLSNLIFFRVLIILVCLLLLIKPVRRFSLKILLILLFINPGLQLYVMGVKLISYQANLEMGKTINMELRNISNIISEKDQAIEEKMPGDENAGSFTDKIKNFFSNSLSRTKEFLEKTADKMMKIANKLLELVISYFVSMLILFLILPVIYFFTLYLITKKFFFSGRI